MVIDTYPITLQFKILHRVYACNYKLFQWKIKDSPECFVCQQIDNLEHYFFYCHNTKCFWNQVDKWLCNLFSMSVNLTVLEVLLGVVTFDTNYYAVNYVILMGKYFICKSKKKQKDYFFIIFNNSEVQTENR